MSLTGEGAICIWHDVPMPVRADYYEWHDREHMPERVGIPGFRRGRRYIAIEGAPEIYTLYETEAPQINAGADYLQRLNNPSAWTRRVAPQLTNNIRSLCRVLLSLGNGQGGLLATLRYDVAAGREEEQRRLLMHRVLPALADAPTIVGVHLCVADLAASSIQTEEKKGRAQQALMPGWIVMVEGGGDVASLRTACDAALDDAVLTAAGASAPIARGLYQLQFSRTKTANTVG